MEVKLSFNIFFYMEKISYIIGIKEKLMKDLINLFGAILLIISMIVMCWLLVSLPYYLIWNWLLAPIMGFAAISFAESMVISFLVNVVYMCYVMIYDSEKVPDDKDI